MSIIAFLSIFVKILLVLEYTSFKHLLYGENLKPIWLDDRLTNLYNNKKTQIDKLIEHTSTSTYIIFHILFSDINKISSSNIEQIIKSEYESDKFNNIDLIIGIETGGAFISNCINYIREQNDKQLIPIQYINIKVRSGKSRWRKLLFALIPKLTHGNILFNSKIQSEDEFKNAILQYNGKNILIVDDSIYSGFTINLAKNYIKNIVPDANINLYTIYNYNKNIDCLHYSFEKYIKMNWFWGYECD